MQSSFTFSLFGHSIAVSSAVLLAVGAGLLIAAGLLLFFARRHRFALQRSVVTDELMVHLSRIAEALERQAARPVDQVIAEALKRSDRSVQPEPSVESHTIPYSMFGREI